MNTLTRHNIVVAGACNSGKSTLVNALLRRDASIVSAVPGTTTDPTRYLIEIPGAGACRIIDTPGIDDADARLGDKRSSQALKALDEAALILLTVGFEEDTESRVRAIAAAHGTPLLTVATMGDRGNEATGDIGSFTASCPADIERLTQAIADRLSAVDAPPPLLGRLVQSGDMVVLVMPQDSEAPKDRLILPQQLVIRALLDTKATAVCVTPEQYAGTLNRLGTRPDLVITDSQVFGPVSEATPADVPLTSFSILMAHYKGDLRQFVDGARTLMALRGRHPRILIAQACSHIPKGEDIGTVKLPALLRKTLGPGTDIAWCYGNNLPDDLTDYDLIIHCGACMFTRSHVLNRLNTIAHAGIPVTNYGVAIAACRGLLPRITLPS